MTYQLRADVHADVPLFTQRTCVQCHQEQAANNRHVQRGQADCRSCHGAGLIASVEHVSSPLNPLRRHAVVCARCHVGASDSFAQYLVHAPRPLDAETAHTFPALFWGAVIMFSVMGMVALLLPQTLLWQARETVDWLRAKLRGGR